jgi:hypothetical protein
MSERSERPAGPDARWRVEADAEWLAERRSGMFARVRRLLGRAGLLGDAVSQAELGPYGGAPRNPQLRADRAAYATVRPAEARYAHTVLAVETAPCRRCGREPATAQRITCVRESGTRVVVGTVRLCAACQGDSWRFVSHMPRVEDARERSRRVVL